MGCFSFRVSLFSFQNQSFPEELLQNEVHIQKIIDFPQTLLLILKAEEAEQCSI